VTRSPIIFLTSGTVSANIRRMSLSHVAIIGLWDNATQLAEDIGVKSSSVRKWRQRGKVPSEHWTAIVRAAQVKNKHLTIDMLAKSQPARNARAA